MTEAVMGDTNGAATAAAASGGENGPQQSPAEASAASASSASGASGTSAVTRATGSHGEERLQVRDWRNIVTVMIWIIGCNASSLCNWLCSHFMIVMTAVTHTHTHTHTHYLEMTLP